MYELEYQFRLDYRKFAKGEYNAAELLYLTCQTLKDFQFYDAEVKVLMNIIMNMLRKAKWRDDIYIYTEWSRKAHFGFLSKYDDSIFWHMDDKVNIDAPIETNYRPMDVAKALNKHWNRIYADPCIYPALIHLLEASDNLLTPKDFDKRIRFFVCNASRKYDASTGVMNNAHSKEDSFEWIRALHYALSLMNTRKGSAAKGAAGSLGRTKR